MTAYFTYYIGSNDENQLKILGFNQYHMLLQKYQPGIAVSVPADLAVVLIFSISSLSEK